MTRTESILKLIVEHFIKTAQPVGSQTLLDAYHLDCSSATIRNEMNALEKDGYLEKTHTSSGRVPSKKGYVYYVEHLRDERVDSKVKNALETVLSRQAQTVEEVIRQSCEILSNMTNLASVVLGPKVEQEKLLSIQLIPLSPTTATALFVTDQGYVENKTFMLQESISMDDVKSAVEMLNERLTGTPIGEVVDKMEAMKPALTDYMVGVGAIYNALFQAFAKFAAERMNLYGKSNLLSQPEYQSDAGKLTKLLGLIDNPSELREALSDSHEAGEDGIHIKIGDASGLDDVAMVSAKVALPGMEKATISLLGPKRMDYDKAMSLLSYVAERLDSYFAGGKGSEEAKCQNRKTPSPKPSKKSPGGKKR
ncbi:MAG TPA: heat-inducible transcription repressor HrcA [Candidatus Enteromonas pullicola]|uniref:Heat-inducible transcription repressor HrcA n=1 Tax=Candidatus Alloenteromonas pullicola TaxID=2840784 RepID=A0A9D1LP37_9FIRM|nr:heat-inducible transcription repressor HrcA [Candidatus Enteromonas pullicola]